MNPVPCQLIIFLFTPSFSTQQTLLSFTSESSLRALSMQTSTLSRLSLTRFDFDDMFRKFADSLRSRVDRLEETHCARHPHREEESCREGAGGIERAYDGGRANSGERWGVPEHERGTRSESGRSQSEAESALSSSPLFRSDAANYPAGRRSHKTTTTAHKSAQRQRGDEVEDERGGVTENSGANPSLRRSPLRSGKTKTDGRAEIMAVEDDGVKKQTRAEANGLASDVVAAAGTAAMSTSTAAATTTVVTTATTSTAATVAPPPAAADTFDIATDASTVASNSAAESAEAAAAVAAAAVASASAAPVTSDEVKEVIAQARSAATEAAAAAASCAAVAAAMLENRHRTPPSTSSSDTILAATAVAGTAIDTATVTGTAVVAGQEEVQGAPLSPLPSPHNPPSSSSSCALPTSPASSTSTSEPPPQVALMVAVAESNNDNDASCSSSSSSRWSVGSGESSSATNATAFVDLSSIVADESEPTASDEPHDLNHEKEHQQFQLFIQHGQDHGEDRSVMGQQLGVVVDIAEHHHHSSSPLPPSSLSPSAALSLGQTPKSPTEDEETAVLPSLPSPWAAGSEEARTNKRHEVAGSLARAMFGADLD